MCLFKYLRYLLALSFTNLLLDEVANSVHFIFAVFDALQFNITLLNVSK